MTPTEHDKKLEVALMELFCRSEEFGRTFLTCASKEEFAEAVNGGALDHQQAAHEAMQLITADRKRVALEAAIMGAKFGNAAIRQHNIANPTKPMNLDAVRDSGIQQAKAWAEQQC